MNTSAERIAEAALAEARQAVTSGHLRVVAGALERLFQITEGSTRPTLLSLRGEGLFTEGLAALREGADAEAVSRFRDACDICMALGDDAQALRLAFCITRLIEAIDRLRTMRRQQRVGREPDGVFATLILHVIERIAAASGIGGQARPGSPEEVTRWLRDHGAKAPKPVRILLAAFTFACGEEATNHQRPGEARSLYEQCARLLEGLSFSDERLLQIAEYLYSSMAFEPQRHGNRDKMHAALDRYNSYLRAQRVDDAWREQHIATQRAYWDMNLAIWQGDKAQARDHALKLQRMATPAYLAQRGAMLRAVITDGEGVAIARHFETFEPSGPGYAMAEFAEIFAAEIITSVHIFRLIRLTFGDDMQVAWRAAALLGKSLAGSGNRACSVLFGKLSARELLEGRLELARHRSTQLDSFADDIATRATRLLADQLIASGRLGEALSIATLIDDEREHTPVPAVAEIPKLVDAACPLSASERGAVVRLQARFADGPLPEAELRAEFARLEAELRSSMPPSPHIDEIESAPPEPGVAWLAIAEVGEQVRATLRGVFGLHSETLAVRPVDLNRIAFDALSALTSGKRADPTVPCRALYDLLISPFRGLLDRQRVRVLVVRSSGVLRRIPLSVLHDGTSFLVEHYAVITHPGSAAPRRREHLSLPIRASSIAVPEAPGMDPLPAARADAALLHRVIQMAGLGYLSDSFDERVDATRLETSIASQPTLLHISSHFEAYPADASRSAFVLSDGSRYSLDRLARLDMSSIELAIVMGCETQSVSEAGGALGITAIDTLLLRMGVGTVLGTAWSINDNIAHVYLKSFLEGVLEDRLDLSEAARRALVATGRDPATGHWRPPHEWGAFVICGARSGLK